MFFVVPVSKLDMVKVSSSIVMTNIFYTILSIEHVWGERKEIAIFFHQKPFNMIPMVEMEEVRTNKNWMCPHCIEEKGIKLNWICNRYCGRNGCIGFLLQKKLNWNLEVLINSLFLSSSFLY